VITENPNPGFSGTRVSCRFSHKPGVMHSLKPGFYRFHFEPLKLENGEISDMAST